MNLKTLLSTVLAASALLAGCAKNNLDINGDPYIKVSKTSLEFEKDGAPQTVTLISNRDWKAQTKAEWITVTPANAKKSSDQVTVSLSVDENTGEERSATVSFTTGSASVNVIVNQQGAIAVQYTTVADFISKADTENAYRLKGKVTGFNSQYCSFDLTDETGTVYVYSVANKTEWADKILNNGIVTLKGTYKYYESSKKHEVVNATILSFEGGTAPVQGIPEGDGSLASPYNPTAAIARAKEAGETLAGPFYIKGYVSSIDKIALDFGNGNYHITDTKEANTEPFYCFQTMYVAGEKFAADSKFALGDEVIVYGKIYNYQGNIPETEGRGATIIYSLNGKTTVEKEEITGENLITSGGFEVWASGKPDKWGNFIASNATISQSSDAFEGQSSVSISGASDSNKRLHSNAISLKAGTYELSLYTKGEGKFRLGWTILENGDVNTNKLNYISNPTVAGETWTRSAERFTLSSDCQVSLIIMNSREGAGKAFLADAVELRTNNGGLGEGGEVETPVDDPEKAELVSVAEFISRASKLYLKVKGVVSGVEYGTKNDKEYLDFDLTDNTGTIKIYGLSAESITEYKDKLKDGNTVTIAGHFSKYGEVNELIQGIILELEDSVSPVFGVSPTAINVSSAASSASIKVSGNVAWTAGTDASWVSLGASSGTGSGTIELTVASNTQQSERTAKITVSTQADVATKSYEVTLTQGAPVSGSGFKKVNDVSGIVAGKYIVTFEHSELAGKVYALTTGATSKNPAGEAVTVTEGVISTADGAPYVWDVTGNNNDGFFFSNSGNYLSSTNAAQGILISSKEEGGWKFSEDDKYGLLMKRADITRCLAAFYGSGKVSFRYYNLGNDYKGKLVLYKLVD